MTKRMLIDTTHAEETRVVVLDGNRLEDYDVETSSKQQLKGNIYLAKVVRVEPSLQAAFVEYGGNRHGFLAFGEIHPDYYQIPVADRQRLVEMQEAEAREEEEAEEEAARRHARAERSGPSEKPAVSPATVEATGVTTQDGATGNGADATEALVQEGYAEAADPWTGATASGAGATEIGIELPAAEQVTQAAAIAREVRVAPEQARAEFPVEDAGADMAPEAADTAGAAGAVARADAGAPAGGAIEAGEAPGSLGASEVESVPASPPPEQIGGETDSVEEPRERRTPRFLRNYKIQEVIRRRQILLVQVVKEERGTKGAALTTYISLAGRFSVLMPNSPRGGGISRKITSAADRRRLKEITAELDLPRGMGLIVRTAGANRPKPEILRDCEYLLDQWDQIRELTMRSVAPALIYEEANLIKRAIRDLYARDVDDIQVDGEQGWRAARDFMRMLMPAHARKVQLWREQQPLFAKMQVEAQLDAMLSPTVQLRSGGYLVINQTEALVAIDVNSGRSTRERGIEETALRTNLEAADEVARQLRLRDLAGLIVVDFIDMEARRHNAMVEKRLKEALKNDRARIQVGSISHFGLLEMSRQRLRPSLAETSLTACPHCGGAGHVRSTESAALHVLRGIEEEGAKRRAAEIVVHVASGVALYVLNHKRGRLAEIEQRYGMRVSFASDDALLPPQMRVERVRAAVPSELPPLVPVSQIAPPDLPDPVEDEAEDIAESAMEADTANGADAAGDDDAPRPGETAEEGERRRKRRRRRRGRGRREDMAASGTDAAETDADAESDEDEPDGREADRVEAEADGPDAAPAEIVPPDAGAVPGAVEIPIAVAPPPEPAMQEQDAAAAGGEAPTADAGSEDAEDEATRAKRRGRRGGRRRRRDPAEAAETAPEEAPAPAPVPAPTPVYAGPTPADPFGGAGAFDIFDVIEQVEQRHLAAATAPAPASRTPADAPEPAEAAPSPGSENVPPDRPTAAAPVPETAAESVASSPAAPEPVAATASTPEPESALEPAMDGASSEPVIGPAVQPVVIGGSDVAVEKKRGWWRR